MKTLFLLLALTITSTAFSQTQDRRSGAQSLVKETGDIGTIIRERNIR